MEDDKKNLEWGVHQDLLEPNEEEELISAVAFNYNGEIIATGDKSGHINIYKRNKEKDLYKSVGRFRSHESEFDYLKSLEIEEKINKIRFLRDTRNAHFLLSTNDKTIKLWRVCNEPTRVTQSKKVNGLNVPAVAKGDVEFRTKVKKVYANAHAYHINSISPNCDGETFISSDDLRINLWNLEIVNQSFNIVDIKPENMEELTEVITSSEFHPTQCSIFMYSSSKGTIKLCDTRNSALCDKGAKVFEEEEDPVNKSFFSEIISSISDIKFSPCGRYILARDYMTLKLWDINKEDKPVKVVPVHDYLKPKLCDLYENDCIFDKFECSLSANANQLISGSYGDFFLVYDITNQLETRIEVRKTKRTKPINPDSIAYDKKCTQLVYHPTRNIFGVASGNNVVLYSGKSKN